MSETSSSLTDANASGNTPQPEVELSPQPSEAVVGETTPSSDKKKTPKRPRRSFIERAQEESEELVRTMGGSLELEGGRRTRSSTRGTPRSTPVQTPPPSKKARVSTPTTSSRNRARKNIAAVIDEPETQEQQNDEQQQQEEETATSNVEKIEETAAGTEVKANTEIAVEESNINAKSSEDKTDAVGELKSIPEEKQNNIDHVHVVADSSENEEPESEQSGTKTTEISEKVAVAETEITPMEVDQEPEEIQEVKATEVVNEKQSVTLTTTPSKVESTTSKAESTPSKSETTPTKVEITPPTKTEVTAPVIVVTPAASAITAEEPKPEAMEVDSVAKSNNAVTDEHKLADNTKLNENIQKTTVAAVLPSTLNESINEIPITEKKEITEPAKNNASIEVIKPQTPPPPSTQTVLSVEKNSPLSEIANRNAELNSTKTTTPPTAATTAAVAATTIVGTPAVGDQLAPLATTEATNTVVSPLKKPNDTEQQCEPTIKTAAETSNDNTTNVSTPQVCN